MIDRDVTEPAQAAVPLELASDASLLRRFQAGNEDAATAIYLRYAKRLRALAKGQISAELASRIDDQDVVQSVFRTFFRRAAAGEYSVPAGDELWKLFLVIALNKIRALGKYHRAEKRDLRQTRSLGLIEPATNEWRDESSYQVLRMVVADLLNDLPPIQREIIQLRIEGFNVAELAKRTQRSKRTVERVLQQFRTRLNSIVDEDFSDRG